MGRNRVLSFMSHFSTGHRTSTPSPPASDSPPSQSPDSIPKNRQPHLHRSFATPPDSDYEIAVDSPPRSNPRSTLGQSHRTSPRPLSMMQLQQVNQPPAMDNEDIIPELQPIFSFLSSHSNRLYHEGYFLKLDDQNTQGKQNPDRTWTECFAQLAGTILSLWDAAELEAAGEDGEVLPKFINLTDASIKMIESMPTRSGDEQPLQNILSVSTAGRNRYLLHFNSHDSLLEWTAGIRLAMFEHSALQEAYTGALIAGKGKALNNINIIMERSRLRTELWARVRFGSGVPWRRCWCVISPPDEKDYAKLQKELKKRSAYDRSPVPILKGDIKFYDSKIEGKKQKKVQPIASITDAYTAYAVYPQSKALVDASTLIKIEGEIAIHTKPPSSSEGFVFVMPETRPAISGFETMMQFLFPVWDTFGLYGRPGKLVASVLDARSLMFAMPKHRQLGYLGLQDVIALLQTDGSQNFKEREWRKRLKEATGSRMNSGDDGVLTQSHSRSASRASVRLSFALQGGAALRGMELLGSGNRLQPRHLRSSSELGGSEPLNSRSPNGHQTHLSISSNRERGTSVSSSDERGPTPSPVEAMRPSHTPDLVSRPPAFNHSAYDRPTGRPYHSPELRQINSRLSKNTLVQMAKAAGGLGSSSAKMDDLANGPAVPSHTSPVKSYFNENDANGAYRDGPSLHQPNHRPSSSYSSNYSAARPLSQHSQYRPGSSHSASPDGCRPINESRPSSADRRSPHPPGPNAGFQGQASPGPRPLPSIPPTRDHQHDQYQAPAPVTFAEQFPSQSASQEPPRRKPLSTSSVSPVSSSSPLSVASGSKHQSFTPRDIINHYTSEFREQYDRDSTEASRHLPPPPPPAEPTYPEGMEDDWWKSFRLGGKPSYPVRDAERPRAGVLKTSGGIEEPKPDKSDIDIPEIDFGPTINYGAPSIFNNKQKASPRAEAGSSARREQARPGPQARRTVPWQPPSPTDGRRMSQRLRPEQFVQQVASAPYGDARRYSAHGLMGTGKERSSNPEPQTHSHPNIPLY